jgi:hypothetical protein
MARRFGASRIEGVDENPYQSPRVAQPIPRSPPKAPSAGVLVAAAIVLPLAVLNIVHTFYVLWFG